jgi:hypothetical protein
MIWFELAGLALVGLVAPDLVEIVIHMLEGFHRD